MNKNLVFKICLIAFLVFWQTASSYIYQIRHYYNLKTKKTIFMLSDEHEMGDKKQNLEQFEKFKKICELLKKKQIKSQVLFEDMFAYTLKYNIEKETKCEKIVNVDNGYKAEFVFYDVASDLSCVSIKKVSIPELIRGESTWIVDLWPYCLHEINDFVVYKSIDPRLIAILWKENIKGLQLLQKSFFLRNFKNLILLKTNFYVERGTLGGKLLEILKKISDEMKNEEFLQKIEECSECKEKIQKVVNDEFTTPDTFFSRALEHEALMCMCCDHDYKYTFLVSGGWHVAYLSKYMETLGFELKNVWGISNDEALNLDSNLQNDLKQKMDDAFDEIYKFIEQEESGSTSSSSSSSSP